MALWIDVGAHKGGWSLEPARADQSLRVIALEPNPDLADPLAISAPPNYLILHAAAALSDGWAPFQINNDDGTSSLLPLSNQNLWLGAEHVRPGRSLIVRTMRLDTVMAIFGVTQVDFLKVDAQGTDLDVLESLGNRIGDVQKIMVEARIVPHSLYERDRAGKDEIDAFLVGAGFTLESARMQTWDQEQDLVYCRHGHESG